MEGILITILTSSYRIGMKIFTLLNSIECVKKIAHSIEWLLFYRLACILRIPRLLNAFY